MTMFHSIECNGPAPTPLYKHCPSMSKGDWDEATAEANAIAAGWTTNGSKWDCPMCPVLTTEVMPKAKPSRQARTPEPVQEPQQ